MSLTPVNDILAVHQDRRRELRQVAEEVEVGVDGGGVGQHLFVDLVIEIAGEHGPLEHS